MAYDRPHRGYQDRLRARMKAVIGAQQAVLRREPDAPYIFRQALIDLAASAELVAEQLPEPRKP
jgi:hypothetical protein